MEPTLERILELMKQKDITALEMETYLGVSKGSFGNWKRGMGRLFYAYIEKIADRLDVTIDYLIRGENIRMESLLHIETELINDFRKMTSDGQKLIAANIKMIIGEK